MNLFKYHNISEGFDFQGIADEFNEHQDELEKNNGLNTDIEYNNIDLILDSPEEKFDVILNFLKKHLKYKASNNIPKTGEFIVTIPYIGIFIKLTYYHKFSIVVSNYGIVFKFYDLSNVKYNLLDKPLVTIVRKFFNEDEVKHNILMVKKLSKHNFIWFKLKKKELTINELNKFLDEIFRLLNKIDLL